jgi:hypothetical protein
MRHECSAPTIETSATESCSGSWRQLLSSIRLPDFGGIKLWQQAVVFAPQSNVNLINGLKTTQDFGNKVPFFGEPLMPD